MNFNVSDWLIEFSIGLSEKISCDIRVNELNNRLE